MKPLSESRRATAGALLLLVTAGCFAAGCNQLLDPGGGGETTVDGDDPLAVPTELDPTTLEALHRDVIVGSCAAQPGLCHNGQFEPNLSTATLMYENLVNRPGIEHGNVFRVTPGKPGESLLIDKLRNKNVLSQMPLGADPLGEDEIAAIEKWIADGALRRPGDAPAPRLNNPPAEPQIGIFDDQGNRLDQTGPFTVAAGTKLVLRHSVQDFETADADVPYAAFGLQLADGRELQLSEAAGDETAGITTYEASGAPESKGDQLNYRFEWTVPALANVVGYDGQITEQSTAGMSLSVVAFYLDSLTPEESMLTFTFTPDLIKVAP